MIIKVTQEHIDNGVKFNCSKCPIALAMTEKFPNCAVGLFGYWVDATDLTMDYKLLPVNANKFIEMFDSGKKVEPFEFEINE